MLRIGLIPELKTPPDTRVALTPAQCAGLREEGVTVVASPSSMRCFTDDEYRAEGVEIRADLSDCDLLLGIKEVPVHALIPGQRYAFFSHTKKAQPHNAPLMRALLQKKITLIDYECLTHRDEQRILGFGLFAGIVGAHNGLRTWGKKWGHFDLPTAHAVGTYADLLHFYDALKMPPLKIAVTGSGKVALGVLEVMAHLDVESVEPEDFIHKEYDYPVFAHLKGRHLYRRPDGIYHRDDFHARPQAYRCLFPQYLPYTDVLMNGVYWDARIPRLFTHEELRSRYTRLSVIADITCDEGGSVPVNLGASTIADPVYGVVRATGARADAHQPSADVVDVMAVDNLPNELPRDSSHYFGLHFIKHVLPELLAPESEIIARATICTAGSLTPRYSYLSAYAGLSAA